MNLCIENLSCGYHGHALTEGLSFQIEPGQVVCLLGPNGVGKTTFFRTVQGFLPPIRGQVFLNGQPLGQIPRRELARHIAYVPQARGQAFAYTVYDMILMGRAAFISSFSAPGKTDHAICNEVIRQLGLEHLSNQLYTQISGGEQQRVLIARALAQRPQFIMMDEPTSNLDFGNQALVLREITRLSRQGLGIMMITHAPEHALLYADKVVLFRKSQPVLVGAPAQILTEATLFETYGVQVRFATAAGPAGETLTTCIPCPYISRNAL